MSDRKYQNSQMIKSMVHGKPSRKKPSQNCMYDIFVWQQNQKVKSQPKIPQSNKQRISNHLQSYNCVGQKHQDIINHQQNGQQNIVESDYMIGKPRRQPKGHPITNQLYMYDQKQVKKSTQENTELDQDQLKCKKQTKVHKARINESKPVDQNTIQKRKQKIKKFKQFTRQLPNSAFTTYYGKPAFESYGRSNSQANLKTHNVMPHRGQNHPQNKQTYEGALLKAKQLKIESHLPRKPIQQFENQQSQPKKVNKVVKLPLQKPDLVNHIRFSQAKNSTERKIAVPSIQQLRKEIKNQKSIKQKKHTKRDKNKQKNSKSLDVFDGLKFMNTRNNLIQIIQQKKLKDTRIAYKVTQCYPQKNAQQQLHKTKTENSLHDEERPAGIAYQKGQPAQNIIYRK